MNATLKISHELKITGPLTVVEHLAACRISGTVTGGYSSVKGKVEKSLSVEMFGVSEAEVRSVFKWMRAKFWLTCAWMDTDSDSPYGEYHGCILKSRLWFEALPKKGPGK